MGKIASRVALGILAALWIASAQENLGAGVSAPVNLNFASGHVGQTPDGWTVPPTRAAAGFRAELRHEGCRSRIGCAVLIPPPVLPPGRDAVIWQQFRADKYRGATLRVRGWVRLDTADPTSRVQMWFRVDRPNRQPGFFDAMEDRPVRSTEWQLCEIVGKVAEDAEYIGLAVNSVGESPAWVDDVSIEFVDGNTPSTVADRANKTPAEPATLGFDRGEEGLAPLGWRVSPSPKEAGYSAELRHTGCDRSPGCAVVIAPADAPPRMFSLVRYIDARPFKGKTLRFRARLKLEKESDRSSAQMWMHVDRANRQVGFYDNTTDRPVRTAHWTDVEITGPIDKDAAGISLGIGLTGGGSAWAEGVTLEVVPDDTPSTVRKGSGFGVATGSFPAKIAAGKNVRFSGYIKTEGVTRGYAGLWWRVDGNSGVLAFDNMYDRGVAGTTDWKRYEINLPVPADAVNINFGALFAGDGAAWFDDLQVELDGVPQHGLNLDLDFESAIPRGFLTGGRGYQVQLDGQIFHSGRQSLRMTSVKDK